ncbi:DUF2235 domain-containing protein [Streptomyces sp. NPDC002766]|uniref:DUF2235 domain-containing protein n=1 Tax=unclassified Streptomyces TaxID=2593676 RepID=UPI003319923C
MGLVPQPDRETERRGLHPVPPDALAIDEQREVFRPTLWHQRPEAAAGGQPLEQVWFTGVHCDIGGGERETGLSDIAQVPLTAAAAGLIPQRGPRPATPVRSDASK